MTIVGICDKEHLGKNFEERELIFNVSEKFFGGEEISEKELIKILKTSDSINLFGNKCVSIAIKEGFISDSSPKTIEGIKHAQVYKI
jgi:uncharacterized protein